MSRNGTSRITFNIFANSWYRMRNFFLPLRRFFFSLRCLSHLRLTYNTYNFMSVMISVLPKTKTKWPWLNLNCWHGVQWPEHQTISHDLSCLLMSSQRERESRACRLVQTFDGIKAAGQVQTGQPLWFDYVLFCQVIIWYSCITRTLDSQNWSHLIPAKIHVYGLLTKLVRSRWLDIDQVLFCMHVYGLRRSLVP